MPIDHTQPLSPRARLRRRRAACGGAWSAWSAGLRLLAQACATLLLGLLGHPGGAWAAQAPQPAASTPAAARGVEYEVRIEGAGELREVLRKGLDIEHWKRFPGLREQQLRALVRKVPRQARELLEAQGYFSSHVDARLQAAAGAQRVWVRVQPGPPTLVGSVQLRVLGPDGRPDARLADALRRHWGLAPGSAFVSARWQAAKGDALLRLSTRRFAAARIADSRALVDPARRVATLSVRFETGPAYRFGPLQVEGLHRYPRSVVRNLMPWSPGAEYAQDQLLEFQAKLQNSRYFRRATVAAPTDSAQQHELPVRVEVVERRAQSLGLGLGFSSNTGVRTQFDYADLNLLGRAWRLDTRVRLETLQQSFGAVLHFPQRADGADYSMSAQAQHADIQGLTTRSQTLGVQRQRVDGAIETVESLQFTNEQQQTSAGVSSTMALMPGWTWIRRRLDSSLDPRRGNLLGVQLGAGARELLSDQNFVRLYLHALQYVSLDPRDQLILRGELGAVLSPSADGIPQQELFRAGGVGSVRGYAYQSLGVPGNGAVLGGRALLTASIEGVRWVRPRWGAALFVDAGNAADGWRALHPVVGYGVGVRWRSPVGLISVDLAHGRATGSTRLDFQAGVRF